MLLVSHGVGHAPGPLGQKGKGDPVRGFRRVEELSDVETRCWRSWELAGGSHQLLSAQGSTEFGTDFLFILTLSSSIFLPALQIFADSWLFSPELSAVPLGLASVCSGPCPLPLCEAATQWDLGHIVFYSLQPSLISSWQGLSCPFYRWRA